MATGSAFQGGIYHKVPYTHLGSRYPLFSFGGRRLYLLPSLYIVRAVWHMTLLLGKLFPSFAHLAISSSTFRLNSLARN